MVVVVVSTQGANTRLVRFDSDPRLVRTHQTTRPNANPEDVESFRRSPATHLRFGFQNAGEARVRGFTA
jgi:hypothetical protein